MFFRSDGVNSENAVARTMNTSMGGQQPESTRFFEYLKIFVRFWGVLTAVVLGGVGVDLVYHRHNIGYYEISGAVIILVLEVLWVVTAFLNLFFRSDQSIWKWWMKVLWVENWKKSILYTPMAIVPLIWPQKLWLSYIASGQLIFLAFVHFLMSLKGRHRKKKRGQILNGDIDSVESRFDEGTDTRNDGLPEPIPGSSLSLADTFARNNPIMEI